MNSHLYDLSQVDFSKYKCPHRISSIIQGIIVQIQNRDYAGASGNISTTREQVLDVKRLAVDAQDDVVANLCFLVEVYFNLLKNLLFFWKTADEKKYRSSWDILQDALDDIRLLESLVQDNAVWGIDRIGRLLRNIEMLYPYAFFASAGIINKTVICSICEKSVFDISCEHIAGNISLGRMASHICTEIECLDHVALVESPADKRCVLAAVGDDGKEIEKDYHILDYLLSHLGAPLMEFQLRLTKRKLPRKRYRDRSPQSDCPCSGGRLFKDCCYSKAFVKNPHYEFSNVVRLKV